MRFEFFIRQDGCEEAKQWLRVFTDDGRTVDYGPYQSFTDANYQKNKLKHENAATKKEG